MSNVKVCPHNYLFGVDYDSISECDNCNLKNQCQKIKEKYKIRNKKDHISYSKANKFIAEIFGISCSYPETLRRNAVKYSFASKKKNEKQMTWTITYENLYKLMLLPLYEVLKKGRTHE